MTLKNQDFEMTQGEGVTLRYTLDTGDITDLTGFTLKWRIGTPGTKAVKEVNGTINQATGPPIADVPLVKADTITIPGSEYDAYLFGTKAGEDTGIAIGKMTLNELLLAP